MQNIPKYPITFVKHPIRAHTQYALNYCARESKLMCARIKINLRANPKISFMNTCSLVRLLELLFTRKDSTLTHSIIRTK